MTDESRKERQIAFVDPNQPGIVRFYGCDVFDGVLAGSRAQQIVDALNAAPPSETAAPRSPIAPTSWPSEEEAKSNYTFTELWQLGQSLTRPDGRICPHRGDAK